LGGGLGCAGTQSQHGLGCAGAQAGSLYALQQGKKHISAKKNANASVPLMHVVDGSIELHAGWEGAAGMLRLVRKYLVLGSLGVPAFSPK
jgi:hypothetical protein